MKIQFKREIELNCVQILVVDYEGEECELDMNCQRIFRAGEQFDKVEFDNETRVDVRIWIDDLFVVLNVPWTAIQIVEL